MSLTDISVRRPAAVIMAIILVIGLGILGYTNIGADLLPAIDTPFISVLVNYNGAGVNEIEKNIIKPTEDALCSINGLDTMRSVSCIGYGYIILQFTMDTNMDTAFMDVQQALGSISDKLPKDASKPILSKNSKNAEPIFMLSVSGSIPFDELYSQTDNIKKQLEKIPGVSDVTLSGIDKKEVHIKVDKTSLESYGININTIVNRLNSENLTLPAGKIKQEEKNQTVRVVGEFKNIDDVKNILIPITQDGTGAVRISDVADVAFGLPDSDYQVRFNGNRSVGIFVSKRSDANVVETTERLHKEFKNIKKMLPKNVSISIAKDSSKFIISSVSEVKKNLIEGIITTILVLLLFLRRVKPSLIVMVAIPTSLLGTFFCMYISGFTFNILSLTGLSACIGILVDDSIVVLENIQRHLKLGKSPIDAALDGRKEIAMAAIAITLCDVVVFCPVAFLTDMIGSFFREFGLTVVYATLFSLAVSFTVTPMLASRLLKKEDNGKDTLSTKNNGKKKKTFATDIWSNFLNKYKSLLTWSLDNRLKIISVVVVGILISISLLVFKFINTEFIPNSDQSRFIINLQLTPGSSYKQTDQKVKLIENHLKSVQEVKEYFSRVGMENNPANAQLLVNLVEKNSRKKTSTQIVEETRKWIKKIPGIDASVLEESIVGQTSLDGMKPIAIKITGSDYKVLKQVASQVEKAVKSIPGTTDVGNSSNNLQSEININIDRLAAHEYGVSTLDIASTLRSAINGTIAGVYRFSGNEYDIVVKFADNQIKNSYDIGSIKVTNSQGIQIPLNQLCSINYVDIPGQLTRENRQSMISISANIEGRVLGSVNTDIKEKLKTITLPFGYNISFGGDLENMSASFSTLAKALIASIVLIYMILVVLYESFLTPLIRMLSLPCGIIGALFALLIAGKSLNIVCMIGLIMLDGVVSKNGTLLIDYTNTLIKRGMLLRDALLESATTRLRPILMTSVTLIVGMLPTALSMGEGSEIKSGMSIILIGGLITSTIISPILIPVVYTLIDDLKKHVSKKRNITNNISVGGIHT